MALDQVINMGDTVEEARIGHQAVSLTHYDDALEPAIAQGSVVEVGGALYLAAANEAIAGLGAIANNSNVYIKLTVAGASVTASGTIIAPTWSTSKQGWYSGAERYIGGLRKDAGGNYVLKWLYFAVGNATLKVFGDGGVAVESGLREDSAYAQPFLKRKVVEIGDWDMDADQTKDVAHGLADHMKVRSVFAVIRNDTAILLLPIDFVLNTIVAQGGYNQINAVNIRLMRLTGGDFDSVSYDSVGFNRGWVTIEYEV